MVLLFGSQYTQRSLYVSKVVQSIDSFNKVNSTFANSNFEFELNSITSFSRKTGPYVKLDITLTWYEPIPPFSSFYFENETSLCQNCNLTHLDQFNVSLTQNNHKFNFSIPIDKSSTTFYSTFGTAFLLIPNENSKPIQVVGVRTNHVVTKNFWNASRLNNVTMNLVIVREDSPDVIFNDHVFSEHQDSSSRKHIFNGFGVFICAFGAVFTVIIWVSTSQNKFVVADMINERMMFRPTLIVSLALIYVEIIQTTLTILLPGVDSVNEYIPLTSLITGDVLLSSSAVESRILKVLYFSYKLVPLVSTIVINMRWKKRFRNTVFLLMLTFFIQIELAIYPIALLDSLLSLEFGNKPCSLGNSITDFQRIIYCSIVMRNNLANTILVIVRLFRNFLGALLWIFIPISMILVFFEIVLRKNDLSYFGLKKHLYSKHTKKVIQPDSIEETALGSISPQGSEMTKIDEEVELTNEEQVRDKWQNIKKTRFNYFKLIWIRLEVSTKSLFNWVKGFFKKEKKYAPVSSLEFYFPIRLITGVVIGLVTSVMVSIVLGFVSVSFANYLHMLFNVEFYRDFICFGAFFLQLQCADVISYVKNVVDWIYGSMLTVYSLSCLISIICALVTSILLFSNYKKKVLNIRRGIHTIPFQSINVVSASTYIGPQASYFGYFSLFFFVYSSTILTIIYAIIFFFLFGFQLFYPFVKGFDLAIYLPKLFYSLIDNENVVPFLVLLMYFVTSNGYYLRAIHSYSIFDLFNTILSMITAPIKVGYQAPLKNLSYFLLKFPRLDLDSSPAHASYMAIMKGDLIYSNPLLYGFFTSCEKLQEKIKSKELLCVLSHIRYLNLCNEKKNEIKFSWKLLDVFSKGRVSKKMLKTNLHNFHISTLSAKSILQLLCFDEKNIQYQDFITVLCSLEDEFPYEISMMYRMMDPESRGYIDKQNIILFLNQLGIPIKTIDSLPDKIYKDDINDLLFGESRKIEIDSNENEEDVSDEETIEVEMNQLSN
eukprot:gene7633-11955_t